MDFTFIAYSRNYNSGFSTTLVVNKPTGTIDGDIMFLHLGSGYGLTPSPTISGWTKLGQGAYTTELWYKIASSEGASYTISWNQNITGAATITTYRGGFDVTDPIDVFSNTDYFVDNTTIRAASMTVGSPNSPLIFFGKGGGTSAITFTKPSTPTTSWIEHYDGGDTDSDIWTEVCSMVWASSGVTGNIDGVLSSSLTSQKHAFAVALNPAPEVFGTIGSIQRIRYRDVIQGIGKKLGADFGYFAGGYSGALTALTDRIAFLTGVTSANTVSNLSVARRYISGVSDKSLYGYFTGGGYTGGLITTTDRIIFSTGVAAANTVSNVSVAKQGITGISDGTTYGYLGGGFSSVYIATTDRIIFSTGATAVNTVSNLSGIRGYAAGLSDGSTYGYFAGGNTGVAVVIADRIIFSTGITSANTVSNLSQARQILAGLSDGSTYGYFAGGYSSTYSSITDRIIFSTGITSANTVSNLSQARNGHVGNSDGSAYGYFVGGDTGAAVVIADRILFSTGVVGANTVSNLSQARYGSGGLADFAV